MMFPARLIEVALGATCQPETRLAPSRCDFPAGNLNGGVSGRQNGCVAPDQDAGPTLVGGVAVQPSQGPSPEKDAGIDGESVGGFVGRSSGGRGAWRKSKSAAMFPSSGSFSR